MNPIQFVGQTHVYVQPKDWDEEKNGKCGDLPICRDDYTQTCRSVWNPTPDERAAIADGAAIELTVYGEQPPVMLGVFVS